MFQLHFLYVQKKWCIVGVLAFLGPNLVSLLCCKVDISGVLESPFIVKSVFCRSFAIVSLTNFYWMSAEVSLKIRKKYIEKLLTQKLCKILDYCFDYEQTLVLRSRIKITYQDIVIVSLFYVLETSTNLILIFRFWPFFSILIQVCDRECQQ